MLWHARSSLALRALQTPASRSPTAAGFDSSRAWEHLRQLVALGPRPAGSAAIEQIPQVHQGPARGAGLTARRSGVGRKDACGQRPHGQPVVTIPGARKERIVHHRTLRHQACPRVPLRGRQRRRIERGIPARARARARRPGRMRSLSSCCSWTAKKPSSSGPGTDHTYGSRHYVDDARKATARSRR